MSSTNCQSLLDVVLASSSLYTACSRLCTAAAGFAQQQQPLKAAAVFAQPAAGFAQQQQQQQPLPNQQQPLHSISRLCTAAAGLAQQ
jgi:hypothetical protein